MRKLVFTIVSAAAIATAFAAPASASADECATVKGNGTKIYEGPAGTLYGVTVDTDPGACRMFVLTTLGVS